MKNDKPVTIHFHNVGRDKMSWSKEFNGRPSDKDIAKEAKKGGRLMSSVVDVIFGDGAQTGEIIVGGFRQVGTFSVA